MKRVLTLVAILAAVVMAGARTGSVEAVPGPLTLSAATVPAAPIPRNQPFSLSVTITNTGAVPLVATTWAQWSMSSNWFQTAAPVTTQGSCGVYSNGTFYACNLGIIGPGQSVIVIVTGILFLPAGATNVLINPAACSNPFCVSIPGFYRLVFTP